MITELIGKKIGMTQIFEKEAGRLVPVTVVQAGPCRVVQVKTQASDGYTAVQVGFEEERKKSRVRKPRLGHCQKNGAPLFRHLREIRMSDVTGIQSGMDLKVDIFAPGDLIHVVGTSKGKGFAGVVKRHGFSGGPMSHGSRFHRQSGSVGHCAVPNKVFRGKRMAGHMGTAQVTTKNLSVVEVLPDQNLLLVRGAVPGAKNGLVRIRKIGVAKKPAGETKESKAK